MLHSCHAQLHRSAVNDLPMENDRHCLCHNAIRIAANSTIPPLFEAHDWPHCHSHSSFFPSLTLTYSLLALGSVFTMVAASLFSCMISARTMISARSANQLKMAWHVVLWWNGQTVSGISEKTESFKLTWLLYGSIRSVIVRGFFLCCLPTLDVLHQVSRRCAATC